MPSLSRLNTGKNAEAHCDGTVLFAVCCLLFAIAGYSFTGVAGALLQVLLFMPSLEVGAPLALSIVRADRHVRMYVLCGLGWVVGWGGQCAFVDAVYQ